MYIAYHYDRCNRFEPDITYWESPEKALEHIQMYVEDDYYIADDDERGSDLFYAEGDEVEIYVRKVRIRDVE